MTFAEQLAGAQSPAAQQIIQEFRGEKADPAGKLKELVEKDDADLLSKMRDDQAEIHKKFLEDFRKIAKEAGENMAAEARLKAQAQDLQKPK